jgi:transcription antitermination factor NusA-like protein
VRLAARLTGWRLDITSETEADETRARYIAEREERARIVEPEAEAGTEEATGDAVEIDPELIRKLEEFKRTMFEGRDESS